MLSFLKYFPPLASGSHYSANFPPISLAVPSKSSLLVSFFLTFKIWSSLKLSLWTTFLLPPHLLPGDPIQSYGFKRYYTLMVLRSISPASISPLVIHLPSLHISIFILSLICLNLNPWFSAMPHPSILHLSPCNTIHPVLLTRKASSPSKCSLWVSTIQLYLQGISWIPSLCPDLQQYHPVQWIIIFPGLLQWPPKWALCFCSCMLSVLHSDVRVTHLNMNQIMSLPALHCPLDLLLLRLTPKSDCDPEGPQPSPPASPSTRCPSLPKLSHVGLLGIPWTHQAPAHLSAFACGASSSFGHGCFIQVPASTSLPPGGLLSYFLKKYPAPIPLYNLILLYFSSEHVSFSDIMIFNYLNLC